MKYMGRSHSKGQVDQTTAIPTTKIVTLESYRPKRCGQTDGRTKSFLLKKLVNHFRWLIDICID